MSKSSWLVCDEVLISIDYCIVAFAIIVIISAVQWVVDGRKNFTGPRVDLS